MVSISTFLVNFMCRYASGRVGLKSTEYSSYTYNIIVKYRDFFVTYYIVFSSEMCYSVDIMIVITFVAASSLFPMAHYMLVL